MDPVKPFDMKVLVEALKAKGLSQAEELAEVIVSEIFDWAGASCAAHSNVMVKAIGVPAVAILKPLALGAVDKIDGQPG
jgi:hypothetical protein